MRLPGRRGPKAPSRLAKPPVALGVIGAVVLLVGSYFIFAKRLPFVEGYRIQAVFQSSNGLRAGSPVRIAGVEVGKVVAMEPGPGSTRIVEMELSDRGRPVHEGATLRIRPRLFLEGGFYVELSPGSPQAPELDDGATIPLGATATPVQFDQILGTFTLPTRQSLKTLVTELDAALDEGGAQAAVRAAGPLAPALRDTAVLTEAARGTEDEDVSRLVTGAAKATKALGDRREELSGLVSGLAATTGALAAESSALGEGLRELAGVVRTAPASLRAIDRALPATEALLDELRPGLRRAPQVLRGTERLLAQLQAASGARELPALLTAARPLVAELPSLAERLTALFPLVTPVTDCVRDRALPVLEAKLDDGDLSTGRPVWQNLVSAATGLTGSGASFDANGFWVRYLVGLGEQTVSTGVVPGLGALTGGADRPVLGSRPTPLPAGRLPAFRPDARCTDQPAPDLRARTGGGTPMRTRATTERRRPRPSAARLQRLIAPKALRRTLRGLAGEDSR
ncbi:MAG TPA: MlaD family protein [Baekduia sp.]|nr:MlaD family protein [Baekduia sp.]